MAIPSIKDGQSDKKGDINCSSKGSNQHFLYKCISTHYVLHNYKVSRNSVEQFSGVVLTNCFSSIFHFGQISKFKKGVNPRKHGIKISYGYAHLHIMSFITTKFQKILLSRFRGVALTNCVE